jgi:hypothetical protein
METQGMTSSATADQATPAPAATPAPPAPAASALHAILRDVRQRLAGANLGSFDWLPWTMLALSVAVMGVLWWKQSRPTAFASPAVALPYAVAAPHATPPRAFDLTTRRWPRPFVAAAGSGRSPSSKLLSPEALEEMQVTYSYYLEQDRTADRFGKLYPDVRPQLDGARIRFDQRFHDALDEIQGRLAQRLVHWEQVRRDLLTVAQERADHGRFTSSAAQAFAAELTSRAGGRIPSPQLEILLAFDPHYLTAPHREYEDGYRRRYSGSGGGKAQGLKIRLEFPRSWVVADSRGSHVVRLFHSRLTSHEAAAILVNPLPMTDDPDPLRWLVTPAGMREIGADAALLDAGRVTVGGKYDALWREYRFTRTLPAGLMKFHAVDFSFLHDRQCVCLDFLVGAPQGTATGEVDASLARNAPLFKLMAQSVSVMDR